MRPLTACARRLRTWNRWIPVTLGFSMLCCLTVPAAAQEGPDESQIQAAFVFNFGKFVDWPENAFQSSRPFNICVIGDSKVAESVELLAHGRNINGREVKVQRLSAHQGAETCQILFIGRDARSERRALLAAVRNLPVLTVGEEDRFAEQGGILNLANEKDHIHLQANPEAALQAGLTISSKLLSLATIVHNKS
jgi:YfiR/HmsC-like